MIIREIKQNPELMKTFDWFNDYDDTLSFIKDHCPELVQEFNFNYKVWLHNQTKEFSKQRTLRIKQRYGRASKKTVIQYFLEYEGTEPYLIREDEYPCYIQAFFPASSEQLKHYQNMRDHLVKEFKIDKVIGFPEKLEAMKQVHNKKLEEKRQGREPIPKHKSLTPEQIAAIKQKRKEYNTNKVREYRANKKGPIKKGKHEQAKKKNT